MNKIIFDLPEIPKSKLYVDQMTPEQHAIQKCIDLSALTSSEALVLNEAIDFYKNVFPKLQEINLG